MVRGDWCPLERRNLIPAQLASTADSRGWSRVSAKELTFYHWNCECSCFGCAQIPQLRARAGITVTKTLGKLQTIVEHCLAGSSHV